MRITKVKVKLNEQSESKLVLMKRNKCEGFLVHENENKQDEIQKLLEAKEKDFIKSVVNKTLVKSIKLKSDEEMVEKENRKNKLNILKKIFEHLFDNNKEKPSFDEFKKLTEQLTKDELKEYLSHKFQAPITFDKKTKKLDLPDILWEALQKSDSEQTIKALTPYREWADWYIKNKQQYLTKSIINNKIPLSSESSSTKRRQVLEIFAKDLVTAPKAELNIELLEKEFKPEELAKEWLTCFNDEQKNTEKDIDEDKRKVLGLPKDSFEFKRKLKTILTAHQRALYRDGKFKDNLAVEQYSLEVTKYLARYFPLKKSSRSLSLDDIEYYLSAETLKKTIKHQLENATKQYLLQKGKMIHYGYDKSESVTSDDLQKLKTQESFTLQFINACAFAANNLRNIVNPSSEKDILGTKDLRDMFKDNPINENKLVERLSQYLFQQHYCFDNKKVITDHQEIKKSLKDNDNYIDVIFAIRGAIAGIRNNVIHFKNDGLEQFLNLSTYELLEKDTENNFSQQNLLRSHFKQEKDLLSQIFAEKLRSSNILDYYPTEKIKQHLTHFTLNAKPLAFVPSFKKIFTWGRKYQFEAKDYLKLKYYFNPEHVIKDKQDIIYPAHQAHYNLLGLIYEHHFITTFLDDKTIFETTVEEVLAANKKRAEESKDKNKDKFAFNGFEHYQSDLSPKEYLAKIQSELINEENKKREEGKLTATETGHYQKFIWQLFVKGFDNYLNNHANFNFICTPEYQFDRDSSALQANQQNNQVEIIKQFIDVTSSIEPDKDGHVAFWLLCKMLDSPHLNELHNQFSKYQQVAIKANIADNGKTDVDTLQQIISLTLLTSDVTPNNYEILYTNTSECLLSLVPFVAPELSVLKQQTDIFVQSDNKTPIIKSPIELTKKYATYGLLTALFTEHDKFKVTTNTIKYWKKIAESKTDNPAALSTERQKLHQEWVKAEHKKDYRKNKTDREFIKGWLNNTSKKAGMTNGQYYQSLCNRLDSYNWLDNQINLVFIRQLHNLLIDILGRLAGFVHLWERDFRFLHEAYFNTSGQPDLPEFIDNNHEFYIRESTREYKNFCYSILLSPVNTQYAKKNIDSTGSWKDKRNYIAHFNYLTRRFNQNGELILSLKTDLEQASLLKLLSHVRELVSYDRKLKNAVAKSFIDLLEKHGINITFEPLHKNHHLFVIKEIKSGEIKHLGGEKIKQDDGKSAPITTNRVPKEYVEMVRALLEFSPKNA
ncbi:MAG: type VI-A CRISPR-associated RNA-guided ribonuclease Cas13a [Enterobacteriaceae bacterium]|jgi:hypothetical protein|nr:type VI-A CRISPR-associated RNA-guided ribonuclease Cas13a [Enterobacteriaceae bacterium]